MISLTFVDDQRLRLLPPRDYRVLIHDRVEHVLNIEGQGSRDATPRVDGEPCIASDGQTSSVHESVGHYLQCLLQPRRYMP